MKRMGGLRSQRIAAFICISILLLFLFLGAMAQIDLNYFSQLQNAGTSDVSPERKTVSLSLYSDVSDWDGVEWTLDRDTLTACISKQTGVLINTECPVQDADMQLSLLLMENKLPDILAISDDNMIRQLISSDKVWNLEEFFEEYKPDAKLLASFSDREKQALIYRDGGWYSIPTCYTSADLMTGGNAIVWNKNLLSELGYDPTEITTEQKFLEVLSAGNAYASETSTSITPLLLGGDQDSGSGLRFLAECFGGTPILGGGVEAPETSGTEGETPETGGTEGDTSNAFQFQNLWTTSGGQEALRFTNELLRKGLLDASSLTYSSRQIRNRLDQGDVLCYIGSVTDFYLDQEQWVTGGLIGVEEDATRYMEAQSIGGYKWTNVFVSKSCTDLAGTAEFLDYMISGDVFSDYDAEEIQKDWWIFKNPMWESRLQIQYSRDTEDDTESQKTLDALQDNASNVKRFDGALLEIPRNHFQVGEPVAQESGQEKEPSQESIQDFETLYNNIQNYERVKISYLVAADSEESFVSRYREFCEGLESLGFQDYEQQMSEVVRENAENLQFPNET